jgi:hypothetical protein
MVVGLKLPVDVTPVPVHVPDAGVPLKVIAELFKQRV